MPSIFRYVPALEISLSSDKMLILFETGYNDDIPVCACANGRVATSDPTNYEDIDPTDLPDTSSPSEDDRRTRVDVSELCENDSRANLALD
jgi:hypothetical protein